MPPSRRRKRPTSGSDALKAYVAILNADHWLFVAANAVDDHGRDHDSLAEIRGLIARRLERLQPEAYKALSSRDL